MSPSWAALLPERNQRSAAFAFCPFLSVASAANASARATRLDEVMHGIVSIKLNRAEADQTRRFAQIVGRIRQTEVKVAAMGSLVPALTDIVTGIGFVAVLALGGREVMAGERSIGDFMSFFAALSLAFQPLRRLGGLAGGSSVLAGGAAVVGYLKSGNHKQLKQ